MFNKKKKYLISGATGSLGQVLVKRLLKDKNVEEIRVFSRDEYKQSEMARKINDERVKYWLGDIRDLERLKEACENVDIIIHTAAMKRMDSCSHNAYEVADVNIRGTKNVMIAGKKCEKIIFVSSDKAVNCKNVYGASKLIGESIVLACKNGIVFRFGNFINSRGSVWEIFKEQRDAGIPLTVTNSKATRFIIDIEEVCDYLLSDAKHGLHYPPNLKSIRIIDLAKQIAPNAEIKIIGDREGEKIHESFNENYSSDKCL